MDHLRELIHPLARVVVMTRPVRRAKVSPLKSVHWPQIARLALGEADRVEVSAGTIAVPDVHALVGEGAGVGVGGDEPEELLRDCARKDAFGGKEGQHERGGAVREHLGEVELEGGGRKYGAGAGAGAVVAVLACERETNEVEIIVLHQVWRSERVFVRLRHGSSAEPPSQHFARGPSHLLGQVDGPDVIPLRFIQLALTIRSYDPGEVIGTGSFGYVSPHHTRHLLTQPSSIIRKVTRRTDGIVRPPRSSLRLTQHRSSRGKNSTTGAWTNVISAN